MNISDSKAGVKMSPCRNTLGITAVQLSCQYLKSDFDLKSYWKDLSDSSGRVYSITGAKYM